MKRLFLVLLMAISCNAMAATATFTPTATATFTVTSTPTKLNTPAARVGPMAVTTPGAAPRIVTNLNVPGSITGEGPATFNDGVVIRVTPDYQYGLTVKNIQASSVVQSETDGLTIGNFNGATGWYTNIMSKIRIMLFSYGKLIFDCDGGMDYIMYTRANVAPNNLGNDDAAGGRAFRVMNHDETETYFECRVDSWSTPTPGANDFGPEIRAHGEAKFTRPEATATPCESELVTKWQVDDIVESAVGTAVVVAVQTATAP